MTAAELIDIAILTATSGCGWAIIAYAGYASGRGWQVGAWLAADFSWLQGLAYAALIGGVVLAVVVGAWWHAFIVIVGAVIFASVMLPLLGPRIQLVAFVGMIGGMVLSAVVVWP